MTIQTNPATADLVAHRLDRVAITLLELAERELGDCVRYAYGVDEPYELDPEAPLVAELFDLAALSESLRSRRGEFKLDAEFVALVADPNNPDDPRPL